MVTLESFVTSLARTANSVAATDAQANLTHEDFWSTLEPTLVAAMESGRFPHMAGLSENAFEASMEDVFEFGLSIVLAGIEALLSRPVHDT